MQAVPALPSPVPIELRTPKESSFVFKYDEAKSRAAWKKLNSASAASAYKLEVTVVGQFETVFPQEPQPMKLGFGHLNAYKHSLILVDVLQSKLLGSAQ